MSITLILHGKQRRKLHLPKQRLAWVGGILFSLLALGGGWLWQSWHQKMEALEVALAVAEQQSVDQSDDEAREQLAMLAAQVGTMQGQLGRLNALGERLTEQADLDPDEFNFKELPPMGGPSYDEELEVSLNELQASMKHLSQQLSSRPGAALTTGTKARAMSALGTMAVGACMKSTVPAAGSCSKVRRVWT